MLQGDAEELQLVRRRRGAKQKTRAEELDDEVSDEVMTQREDDIEYQDQ
jgi:hypothetical protein